MKSFTDYMPRDFKRLSVMNLQGYIYINQLALKQMLITKGRLEAITRSRAMEMREMAAASTPAPINGERDEVSPRGSRSSRI